SWKQWKQYLIELYINEERESDSERQADLEEEEIVFAVISNESVTKAIQKLKNREAPGIDNITNEMIKYGKNTLITITLLGALTKLFPGILRDKITEVTDINGEQQGFRRNRTTTMQSS
ncbi:hypothetical protein HHI36_019359, partial [Cryptolaemus montrouzieri]